MKCLTDKCRNYRAKGRKYCNTCVSRKQRQRYPLKYSYYTNKYNAKRRGKSFELTFDQFKEFAIETEYFVKKGVSRESLHIDRKDETKGYTIDNIQVLPNYKNVKKYLRYFYDEKEKKMNFSIETSKRQNLNTPF